MSTIHYAYQTAGGAVHPRCGCDSCYRRHKVKSLELTKTPSEVTCKRCLKAMPARCDCCNSTGYHEFEGVQYQCTDAQCEWTDKSLPIFSAVK